MLEAWLAPPSPVRSASDGFCPVPTADLTRRSSLHALCLSQIAPRSTLCVRADRRLLLDRTKSFRTGYRLLCTRHFAFHAALGLLLARPFLPCTAHELLRARPLTLDDGLRIAPYAITWRPCLVHGFLRAQRFKLRTGHRLLCVRHLTLCAGCRLLRFLCSAP